MSAPVIEEKQHQATPTNPPATSDDPPSFESAVGTSSQNANTNTTVNPSSAGPAPAGDLPPAVVDQDANPTTTSPSTAPASTRDQPPAVVEQEGQTPATSTPSNTYGYAASPPGGMNTMQPLGVGQGAPEMVTPLHGLPDTPVMIDCPFCFHRAMTRVETEGSPMQLVAGIVCCIFCVCLACVPCLAGWFENTHVHCSNCNKRVATIPHDGPIQVYTPQMYMPVPSQYPAQGPPQYDQQGRPLGQPQSPPPATLRKDTYA